MTGIVFKTNEERLRFDQAHENEFFKTYKHSSVLQWIRTGDCMDLISDSQSKFIEEKLQDALVDARKELVELFHYSDLYTPNSIQAFIFTGDCGYLKPINTDNISSVPKHTGKHDEL